MVQRCIIHVYEKGNQCRHGANAKVQSSDLPSPVTSAFRYNVVLGTGRWDWMNSNLPSGSFLRWTSSLSLVVLLNAIEYHVDAAWIFWISGLHVDHRLRWASGDLKHRGRWLRNIKSWVRKKRARLYISQSTSPQGGYWVSDSNGIKIHTRMDMICEAAGY